MSDSRRVLFEECRFDGERVSADGVLSEVPATLERVVISADGGDVEMVVTAMTLDGGGKVRWHAEDVASWIGRHTVLPSTLEEPDEFSTPLARPGRRISGSGGSGVDTSRPGDHGLLRSPR